MSKLNNMDYLVNIQSELKAPKNQFNNFGKYKYRSAEDILEALKPLLNKYGCYLTITEKTEEIAGKLVLTSKVTISDGNNSIFVEAQAGINPDRKGMDIAQSFGSSSSYAKKYALGNLFLLDDTKDADATTNPKDIPGDVKPAKITKPYAKSSLEPVIFDGREVAVSKPKMTTDIYNSMLEYINTGKGSIVAERMDNYTMTKKQESTLTRMINQNKAKNDKE